MVNQKYKPGIGACDAAVPKGAAALAACVAGPLTKLLAFAETTILNEAGEGPVNVSSVPVYLGATAGLRLLVPEHSTAIMGAVRSGRVQFLRTLPGVLCLSRQLTNWFPLKYGVRHLAPYTLSPTGLIFRRSPWECRAARPRRTSSARTLGV